MMSSQEWAKESRGRRKRTWVRILSHFPKIWINPDFYLVCKQEGATQIARWRERERGSCETNTHLWRQGQRGDRWRPVSGGQPWGSGDPYGAGRDSGTTQTAHGLEPGSVGAYAYNMSDARHSWETLCLCTPTPKVGCLMFATTYVCRS